MNNARFNDLSCQVLIALSTILIVIAIYGVAYTLLVKPFVYDATYGLFGLGNIQIRSEPKYYGDSKFLKVIFSPALKVDQAVFRERWPNCNLNAFSKLSEDESTALKTLQSQD